MTEIDRGTEQEAKAVSAIVALLVPAVLEQARNYEVCPDCLFQNLATTLLLNVGLKFLHEGLENCWLAGVDEVVEVLRATYAAPGELH